MVPVVQFCSFLQEEHCSCSLENARLIQELEDATISSCAIFCPHCAFVFFFWGGVENDSRERASSCTFFNSIPLILQEHSEWPSQRSFECEAEGQSEFDKLNRQILCG